MPKPLLEDHGESGTRSFFAKFTAFFLAVCLLLLSLEGYTYLLHPAPRSTVRLPDLQPFLSNPSSNPFGSHRPDEIQKVLEETATSLKLIANFIASHECPSGDLVCESKALFYFVRDQIAYVPDPRFHDALQNPLATLRTGGADCEDMAVLVAGLQKAIGNEVRLVFVPGHAYAQVRIPDYRDEWLNLETTCKTCKFNDLPNDIQVQPKEFSEL